MIQHTETESVSHEPVVKTHIESVSVKKAEVHHSVNINTTTAKPKGMFFTACLYSTIVIVLTHKIVAHVDFCGWI